MNILLDIFFYAFKLLTVTMIGIVSFELLFWIADVSLLPIHYFLNHILQFLLDIGARSLQSSPDLHPLATTSAYLLAIL